MGPQNTNIFNLLTIISTSFLELSHVDNPPKRSAIKSHNNRKDLEAEQSIKERNVGNGRCLDGEAIFSAGD